MGNQATLPPRKVSKSKDNSYSHFLRHQVAFEQDLDFEISASTFLSEIIEDIPDELFNDYRKGIVSDSDLWNSIINYQKEKVKALDDTYFIISNNVLTKEELIGKISSNKIDQAIS